MPIAALVVLSGCPGSKSVSSQDDKQRVRIRSFSEPGPVRMLVAAEPYVFSAFDQGLDRWDLSSGQDLKLSAEHGLPGDRVAAMAYDPGRRWLWLVTDGGMTRYEVNVGTFAELPAPPSIYGLQDLEGAVLAPAGDGGLWLGHRRGLFYTTSDGRWTDTGITDPVSALMRSRDGWLWIGTSAGLVGRRPDGETAYFGESKGCDLDKIRFIASAPGGGPLIVGENKAGKQRVVLIMNETCSTYRASPDERWLSADRRAGELIVLTSRRLYSVGVSEVGARSLSREGMRLVPVAVPPGAPPPPRSPYFINALDVPVPVGAEVVAATPSEILVGTHSLGTARLATTGKSGRVTWLRRNLLVRDAAMLSVACMSAKDCFVATAARQAWRFRGDGFEPVDVAQSAVLAFVRSSGGDIYALARSTTNESEIVAYRNADGEWSLVADLTVKVPGRRPELAFARFSPSDLLWLGLRYEDGNNEQRPHGVALVDMNMGMVAYHHASRRDKFKKEGIMPIPIGVVDVAFLEEEEVWLASSEGAVLVRAEDVTVFTEADGLESELLRGVAVTSSGIVFIATGRGVSSYDGTEWTFPKALRWSVNDVEVGRDGRLWLATDRGVAVYDGARVRRLDQRRGLLENEIEEIVIDHLHRVWARGSQGFTLITP